MSKVKVCKLSVGWPIPEKPKKSKKFPYSWILGVGKATTKYSKSMKISHFCKTTFPIEPVGCKIKFFLKSKIVPLYPLCLIYAKKKFFGSPFTHYSLASNAHNHYST